MTVTDETGVDAHRIVVRDKSGPLPFQGEMIADLTWSYEEAEERGHQRWTDIALYKVFDDSRYAYVIQVMARSVVYHKPGLPCQRGVSTRVGRLREDEERYDALYACEDCGPTELEELDDAATVSVEANIPTLHKCRDAHEAVKVLSQRSRTGKLSGINLKILQAASDLDHDIAEAMIATRGL